MLDRSLLKYYEEIKNDPRGSFIIMNAYSLNLELLNSGVKEIILDITKHQILSKRIMKGKDVILSLKIAMELDNDLARDILKYT